MACLAFYARITAQNGSVEASRSLIIGSGHKKSKKLIPSL
jgi:hypothetical protein